MAEITDPLIVNWANERARVLADRLRGAYDALASYRTDYAAQGIAAAISAAGGSDLIADGSEDDGRPRITGDTLINFKAALDQIDTAMGTTAVTGVGTTANAQVNLIQVNGGVR